jgi:ribosomal protein S18 acetylase RimI-like enzyme
MYLIANIEEKRQGQQSPPAKVGDGLDIGFLTRSQEQEALEFLSARLLRTFGLVGFIRQNGIDGPRNRGRFYACRDKAGRLEGVALIGHAVMFEAASERAVGAFAKLTRANLNSSFVLGEKDGVGLFCDHYSRLGRVPRLMSNETLFQARWPVGVFDEVPGLRTATLNDLHLVVEAHARMGFEERGISPLDIDPEGFVERCRWRVKENRTWVWVEGGRLLFKAEVVFDLPQLAYLEGVWVPPEERSKGYGVRCMSQMSRTLLRRSQSVLLLAEDHRRELQALYRKVGFKCASSYQALFL